MPIDLRPYQDIIKRETYDAWNAGTRNVLQVLPTGAGKTVVFADIIREHSGASCSIAHRQELVSQMSLALARDEIRHKVIGPTNVVKLCVNLHMIELGRSYYDPSSVAAVAGVDTLTRRGVELATWSNQVTLWVQDEAHHVLRANKWGRAADMFPNARGLGVTATPERADGKGLGRHADGLFDIMIEGPGMRALIDAGYLTDYRIFAPPSDIDLTEVTLSKATGDYSKTKLVTAVRKSHIVGDVVEHYLRIAPGKLGITFATDVETATDIAAQFNAAGISAAVVSAKTPDAERVSIVRRFRNREILQLVNVDIFGEGFDLPAIEVVSFARPTQSLVLYRQQFGRALRPMEGKDKAIIIDHVGNATNPRFGLPDARRVWTLNARERRGSSTDGIGIPVRSCPECTAVYKRTCKACPYCGFVALPTARSGPEFVDGDLCELDAATLAKMRGEIDATDQDKEKYREWLLARNVPPIHQLGLVKKHVAKQDAQTALRAAMGLWGGVQRAAGVPVPEAQKIFYFTFGIDVGSAQSLKRKDAAELMARINATLEATV